MHPHIATIEILLDKNGRDTRVVARLRSDDAPEIIGTGLAARNRVDADSPKDEETLATARALVDLADQLFEVVNSVAALPTGWSY
jgi:hypothetical protein